MQTTLVRLDGSIQLTNTLGEEVTIPAGTSEEEVASLTAAFMGPPPVPQSVTPRQLHLALIDAGQYEAVTGMVDASDARTRAAWHYAIAYDRTDPMLVGAATALGMFSEDIDNLFRHAATL